MTCSSSRRATRLPASEFLEAIGLEPLCEEVEDDSSPGADGDLQSEEPDPFVERDEEDRVAWVEAMTMRE